MSTIDDRQQLRQQIQRLWQPPLVYIAAKLGLADILENGPQHSDELAGKIGANAPALRRVLRAMVAGGLLAETDEGRFALTPMGELLRRNRPDSLAGEAIIAGEAWPAWGGLLHSIYTGEAAFDHVFGTDMFTYFTQNPTLQQHFGHNTAQQTKNIVAAVAAAYNFSAFQCLVDVGGGYGPLLKTILSRNPNLQGILFDLPPMIEGAAALFEPAQLLDRCKLVPGSFFESVPPGGDAYLLQYIIHDWDDVRATQILKNCRQAMGEQGTLLLVERLMPHRVTDSPSTIRLDLSMLVFTGGRERTQAEYTQLLTAAGFELTKITPTSGPWSIIEGAPV